MHKENFTPPHDTFSEGFHFILYHFNQDRLFPRTIMTKKLGYQKEVFSKEEAIKLFEESDFIDCRINAFPSYIEYKRIQRYPPDFIFIDLDNKSFKTERAFEHALSTTLKNISEKLDGYPTVLSTGGGYHIYQPIDAFILEEFSIFNEFENPSKHFLRFAKDFLSNNKADKANNPSFKSCLLRVPFSFNSKYLSTVNNSNFQVKIIQEWDKKRPSIKYLLRDFRRYLITLKIQEMNMDKGNKKVKQSSYSYIQNNPQNNSNTNNTIYWIEKLLKTPIADFRKNSVSLILAPYLINIKNISYQESFDILIEWLRKCDSIRKLEFNPRYLIKSALNTAIQKRVPPMKLKTLSNRNLEIYGILQKL
jgi:hypothetical protein